MTAARETEIPGCLELALPRFDDERGHLVKLVQRSVYDGLGLTSDFTELFYSRSRSGVVRGLHFQLPPRALFKIVTCITGCAWDVVVDLREGSPAFGRHVTTTLEGASAVVVPAGCAHGALAMSDDTVLAYGVTEEHSPDHDAGVRWDSAGIDWPLQVPPIVSPRDAALPRLEDFQTPFRFSP